MDIDIKNNKRARETNNNNNNNNIDNNPVDTKRAKREMPALDVLNYLDDSVQESMFYDAIKKHDLAMVQFLVENSKVSFDTVSKKKYVVDKNDPDQNVEFLIPVVAAVLANSYEITDYLLSKKFQTFFKLIEQDVAVNATSTACVTGNCKILRLLIDHEPEVLSSWPADLPLHITIAGRWNNANVIEVLHQNGVDINSLCAMKKQTALHIASEQNACEAVSTLIKLGANINMTDKDNYTPLSIAVKHKSFEVIKTLLNYGADLFITDADENKNAVRQALKEGSYYASKLLQLLAIEGSNDTNRIKITAQKGNFDISVIPEIVMEALKLERTKMLFDRTTYCLVSNLLTDERTKDIAQNILEGMVGQYLNLFEPKEEQEQTLKENKEFIAGMKIFSNVPDEPKRKILSFLCPQYTITFSPVESRKVEEIAEVIFSSRVAPKM